MRVILVLSACALALPSFAGGAASEITLPDTREESLESSPRASDASSVVTPAEGIADDPTTKDHSNQCDEPDGPPCGQGG